MEQVIKEVEKEKTEKFVIENKCSHCFCRIEKRGANLREVKVCCKCGIGGQ